VFVSGSKRFKLFVQNLNATDLVLMRELVESGTIRPVVERSWSFSAGSAALSR
jgi:hypothetical protein